MKVVVSGCPRSFSGLVNHPKQPFGFRRCNGIKFNDDNVIKLSQRISGGSTQYFPAKPSSNKYVLSAGRNQYQWSYQDDMPPEPFVLTLVKEVVWGVKWLFSFLIEQPSQLKYLEWPSFQSTVFESG
ncbi:uncharacterized protein LOC110613177 isoform X2 [Manihot esculenta]|uniref:Uncharacterized protein n=1 Tax=Manihot esculenta TaxID=3983 RepID=A0ACB7HUM1_MANES|nr:uncharacterized protein LOC110613177 isoform X2 [Manihot esculenta]KAG8655806.1 hypothetical protein MANES_04G071000v8 [Manihot esculenta]